MDKSWPSFSLRMKRASSLNFLNKSVEEPVQVWVGGCQGTGQLRPRAQGLHVSCIYLASFSKHVSSSSNISCLCPRPGFGLDTGKTNEGNPNGWTCKWPVPAVIVEVCGSVKSTRVGLGQAQGLWLVSPLPLPTREAQTGSSMRLSQLLPLPTAWRHRPL